jgi:hypothetical protein
MQDVLKDVDTLLRKHGHVNASCRNTAGTTGN